MNDDRDEDSIQSIQPSNFQDVTWFLAPSKSHMIRWILLASMSDKKTRISFSGKPGEDIYSMANCIERLGIEIKKSEKYWEIHGKGTNGFCLPNETLDCRNSGTTMRFLIPQVACFSSSVILDGDWTLRNRHLESSTNSIEKLGAAVEMSEGKGAPYSISGPLNPGTVILDTSTSSQSLSSLVLLGPRMSGPIEVITKGKTVSNRHAALTFEIAKQTGSKAIWNEKENIIIQPWTPICPENVIIPSDLSLAAFGLVLATVHDTSLDIVNPPNPKDGIGAEILYEIIENKPTKEMHLDLLNCNDLLPALSAYLALGPGGQIRNASHARFKESDRISKTIEMLSHFGLQVNECEDGIQTEGRQIPTIPENIVNVYGDHRLFMTAACIASKTGGKLTDKGIWRVTDPLFPQQIGFD
ncbi:MAG: hypothetical protein CBC45_004010 [Euryarchaeota archaeon TMED85]|nr:MAG: hypothetical protein CMA04_005295 [Euryarchaeota archaeon]RPG74545.1 MAG: hypothetical protein CBC45_004010 [Euryarchaeota archaeon TMED85]